MHDDDATTASSIFDIKNLSVEDKTASKKIESLTRKDILKRLLLIEAKLSLNDEGLYFNSQGVSEDVEVANIVDMLVEIDQIDFALEIGINF